MRWWAIAVAGCNSVFGLHDVEQAPPEFFDAPADGAFVCPPTGVTPVFRPAVHSLPVAKCTAYTISTSADRAIATCQQTSTSVVAEGALEGTLDTVQLATVAGGIYFQPRLAASGDVLVRPHLSSPDFHFTFELAHRDAALAWSAIGSLPYDQPQTALANGIPAITTISAGPDRRAIALEQLVDATWHVREFADTGSGWTQRDTYLLDASFTNTPRHTSLSADGLRLVLATDTGVLYADRPTLADRFVTAQPVMDLPSGSMVGQNVDWPVIDDNCGKLYFTALGTTFFVERE